MEKWLRTLGLLGFDLGKVQCLPRQTPAGHGRNSAHSGHGRNSAHSGHGRNSAHSGHGRKSGLSGHGQISGQSGHLRISGHSGRASLSGREITFWHGEGHSHFQPEVFLFKYKIRIFKTNNSHRFWCTL